MFKYILLNALSPEDFGLDTTEEIVEALEEFGCKHLYSHSTTGQTTVYAVANDPDVLVRMCETVELPGTVLEYTAVFDQFMEI